MLFGVLAVFRRVCDTVLSIELFHILWRGLGTWRNLHLCRVLQEIMFLRMLYKNK